MSQAARVRVYIACSLDGFIAGADNDLSWLPQEDDAPDPPGWQRDPGAIEYADFIANVGALLMGRGTFDVVQGFGVDWPYGDRPVLVPTHRPLETDVPTVRAVSGSISDLVAEALAAADGKDVYIDGGVLIRDALDAGLIDDMIITMSPTVLGSGHPLFAGALNRHPLEFINVCRYAFNMVQLHVRPLK